MIIRHPSSSFAAYFRTDCFVIVRMSLSEDIRLFYTSSGDTTDDIEGAREYATVLINPDNSFSIMAHKLSPSFAKGVFETIDIAIEFVKDTNKQASAEAIQTVIMRDLEAMTVSSPAAIVSSTAILSDGRCWSYTNKDGDAYAD